MIGEMRSLAQAPAVAGQSNSLTAIPFGPAFFPSAVKSIVAVYG